ncbi:FAD-dependent oxidoreductase [Anoxybacterium hadale]|uniref:FAD-dependent oxidoreductase n=1 Tax=Anoxybacterium hadale TaxID=3408580 RepID=A0ACD1A6B4_9FIRM|nr:FAD-dependent oxidoreductase [Clostridiales bacterium]
MTSIQTELAIVAAGPAGLAAAITAAERDIEVVVFEKASVAGGTANMGMGPLGVESRLQKELLIGITKEEAFQIMMEHTHWNVDARLVREYLWKSGETIDWLEDMGVTFDRPTKYYPGADETWHVVKPEDGGIPGPRAASAMTKVMYQQAKKLGVQFHFETPVKSLIKDDSGRITGFKAEAANGEIYEVEAKAVLVACGGFGNNPEMIREYTGHVDGKDMYGFRIPGIDGDGLKMVWNAGGGKSHMEMERILGNEIPNVGCFTSKLIFSQASALIINRQGYRIINEEEIKNGAVAANSISRQYKRDAFQIIDDSIIKHFKRNGPDFPSTVFRSDFTKLFYDEIDDMIEQYPEAVFKADTIEQLAEKLGINMDTLINTIEEYNEGCEKGYDDVMGKNRKYLHPLIGRTFYAQRISSSAYGSLGGVRTNHKLEVLTDEFETIPGLYAAGTDVCDLYAGTYCYRLGGNTMGFAINSGRIAADAAVDYIFDSIE